MAYRILGKVAVFFFALFALTILSGLVEAFAPRHPRADFLVGWFMAFIYIRLSKEPREC